VSAREQAPSKHVVPSKDGWAVRNSGAERATKSFGTKEGAVSYAREMARKERSDLFIHNRDGTIRERSSFGGDPYPPKDKK
jgi:hypothetical protein